jgi:nicotinamidase-related amidase
VLLIDFARGWTDPESPMALPLDDQLAGAGRLVRLARRSGVPIVYVTSAYEPGEIETVRMLRKTPRVAAMRLGSPLTDSDPRIGPAPGEQVVVKKHASAFFGTTLASQLIVHGIDTVLIGGCITSGCVRAAAVDAAQLGFRALVVEDIVGDRSVEAHVASLRSIDALYGDVISLHRALEYLRHRA